MGGGGFAIGLEGSPILFTCLDASLGATGVAKLVDADAPVADAPCLLTSCFVAPAGAPGPDPQKTTPASCLGSGRGSPRRCIARPFALHLLVPAFLPHRRFEPDGLPGAVELDGHLRGHARLAVGRLGRSYESDGRTGTSTCNGSRPQTLQIQVPSQEVLGPSKAT